MTCNVPYDSELYIYVASYPVICCHVETLSYIPIDRLSMLS
jgi:hypothetical protein